MVQIEIDSRFTNLGVPDSNINTVSSNTYPQIRILQTTGSSVILIVGTPDGTGQNTNGVMTSQGDGFYSFLFTSTIGFDPTQKYLISVDGGPSLQNSERYQASEIDPASLTPTDLLNVQQAVVTGTSGLSNNLYINVNSVLAIVNLILKNQQQNINLVVDPVECTLTVNRYEREDNNIIVEPIIQCNPIDDIQENICSPPIHVFDLIDLSNTPSISEALDLNYP